MNTFGIKEQNFKRVTFVIHFDRQNYVVYRTCPNYSVLNINLILSTHKDRITLKSGPHINDQKRSGKGSSRAASPRHCTYGWLHRAARPHTQRRAPLGSSKTTACATLTRACALCKPSPAPRKAPRRPKAAPRTNGTPRAPRTMDEGLAYSPRLAPPVQTLSLGR